MGKAKKIILELYPTTKLLAVAFIALSVFIVPGFIYPYLILPVCMLIAYIAGCFKEFSNLAVKGLFTIVLFIFIIQSLFYPGTTVLWSWGFLSVKLEGVLFSLNLTSRVLAIGSAFILFFRVTKVKDFVYSLEAKGLPSKVTFVILSTLQIVPEMKKLTFVIMDAQRTRGVETEGSLAVRAKAFLPTLSPLILGSIASTEERVLTLEARGFTATVPKTRVYRVEKTKYDPIVRRVLLILLIILVIGRIASWM